MSLRVDLILLTLIALVLAGAVYGLLTRSGTRRSEWQGREFGRGPALAIAVAAFLVVEALVLILQGPQG